MKPPKYLFLLSVLLASSAFAQVHDSHAGRAIPKASTSSTSAAPAPSNAGFAAANAKMHKDMAIALTGNADRDFLAGMIPHHQGAIDMAQVVLKHGKDPKVKQLAQDIIKAQKKEIAMMKAWLAQQK